MYRGGTLKDDPSKSSSFCPCYLFDFSYLWKASMIDTLFEIRRETRIRTCTRRDVRILAPGSETAVS